MSADTELTIRLFLLGTAVTVGLEAMKAERVSRWALGIGTTALCLGALFLEPLAKNWPEAGKAVGIVAQSPLSWFFLACVFFMVGRQFWRPKQPLPSTAPPTALSSAPRFLAEAPRLKPFRGAYEGAHKELLLFITERLLPAVDAMFEHESGLAAMLPADAMTVHLIQGGITNRQQQSALMVGVNGLRNLTREPLPHVEQAEMERHVNTIKTYYPRYAGALIQFEKQVQAHTGNDPAELPTRRRFVEAHEAMVEAYDPIRREPALPTLFSARPVKWEATPLLGLLGGFNPPGEAQ